MHRAGKDGSTSAAELAHSAPPLKIPLPDTCVDLVVSGLVLNFIPDPATALAEMARVTGTGGTIGAYVWDYAERMELMRYFWDAAVELDASAVPLDEGVRFPLCQPKALTALFNAATLDCVEVTAIDIPMSFASFDDYWEPFLGGQGPAPTYAMSFWTSPREHGCRNAPGFEFPCCQMDRLR